MSTDKPYRFGIVDVGTNAVRFEIYQCERQKVGGWNATRIYQRREVVRLGDTLSETKRLNSAALPLVLQAFSDFAKLTRSSGVQSIKAAGTSIFREALDAESFRKQINLSSHIEIEIISGSREAALIVEGIRAFEAGLPATCFFVDIGGGSTEVSACIDSEIYFSHSLPIGAIKAQKQYLQEAPPSVAACQALSETIFDHLACLPSIPEGTTFPIAVCSSGTARALSDIRENVEFDRTWLETLATSLLTMNEQEIHQLVGVKEKRSDIILAGALLLRHILDFAKIEKVRISPFSLRHGLLIESLREAGLA